MKQNKSMIQLEVIFILELMHTVNGRNVKLHVRMEIYPLLRKELLILFNPGVNLALNLSGWAP